MHLSLVGISVQQVNYAVVLQELERRVFWRLLYRSITIVGVGNASGSLPTSG